MNNVMTKQNKWNWCIFYCHIVYVCCYWSGLLAGACLRGLHFYYHLGLTFQGTIFCQDFIGPACIHMSNAWSAFYKQWVTLTFDLAFRWAKP